MADGNGNCQRYCGVANCQSCVDGSSTQCDTCNGGFVCLIFILFLDLFLVLIFVWFLFLCRPCPMATAWFTARSTTAPPASPAPAPRAAPATPAMCVFRVISCYFVLLLHCLIVQGLNGDGVTCGRVCNVANCQTCVDGTSDSCESCNGGYVCLLFCIFYLCLGFAELCFCSV